jgi:predicted metal-dependent phosphoesterase TrpH
LDAKADLHLHTRYSDGACSTEELIDRADRAGLKIISITDHDSVGAIDEAIELGKKKGIDVVPGIELSATFDGTEVHVLGYFIDHHNTILLESLEGFQRERVNRARRIVGKLNQLNVPLTIDSVMEEVEGESVGRPHIATALLNGGHTGTYYEAFNKYIGNGKPAYEQKWNFTPEETINLIAQSGGLSFLAHPGRSVKEDLIFRLIKAGLDGIEVIHPAHSPDLVYYYRGIVNEYCLLNSGGSDFHGGDRNDENSLGQFVIPSSVVETMRRRLFSN